MNAHDILNDFASRPVEMLELLRGKLNSEVANAFPGGHDNSISWLLWHTGREIDMQVAMLSGGDQVWASGDYGRRTGLSELGAGMGYGDSPEQARKIQVTEPELLLDYVAQSMESLQAYVAELSEADFDEVIDESYTPAVTRGVRLVSIVDDAAQHVGQIFYALGILGE